MRLPTLIFSLAALAVCVRSQAAQTPRSGARSSGATSAVANTTSRSSTPPSADDRSPAGEPRAAKRASGGIEARTGSMRADDEPAGSDDVRVERFVLVPSAAAIAAGVESAPAERGVAREAAAQPARATAAVDPSAVLGVIEWRRLAHADGFQIECEILFARAARALAGQRVLHVEDLCAGSARLVWREMGAGSGRSLLAEWTSGGSALRTVEWDKKETLREEISAGDGAVMPLYLIEIVREGRATSGRYRVFEPLSRALSDVELFTSYGDAADASDATASDCPARNDAPARKVSAPASSRLRTVELLRADGSLCGRYRFRGAELVAFQWQEGGPWARRASAAEYDAALRELERRGTEDP